MVLIVGNVFFFIAMFIIKIFEISIMLADTIMGNHKYKFVGTLIRWTMNVSMFLIIQIIQILLLVNQRQNEYSADNFAVQNNYGADLIDVLYVLDQLDFGGRKSILERLKSSHPYTSSRIARLERNIEKLEEQQTKKQEKKIAKQQKIQEQQEITKQLEIETMEKNNAILEKIKSKSIPNSIQEVKNITPKEKWVSFDNKEFETEEDLINYLIEKSNEEKIHNTYYRRKKVKELYGEDYKISDDELPY